ncbi:MAG: ribosomal protein S9 [uncultured bacterium (gcode 4)]|uniref:Small ribosomal subunit protein uS9 n=1 Tax=uncultured bacterium (gcode 4) TaxID=1234023 RepID=K1X3U3_9BACT|nr:MAG: ribosomal protein S9 [uncultured bacterium (gcode 4)]HBB04384.1 30S ribosomal protein S9 [Candidatus Gracilibacteria bacterium]
MANKEYTYAIGRRKETTAVVKLFGQGTGSFMIKSSNGSKKLLADYFGGNLYLLENALSPLQTLGADYLKKFDAEIVITGGGISGQADAIKLGIARALIEWNAELRLTLKPYGLLKRDPRIKERKKPGLKKARKGPTWSKR